MKKLMIAAVAGVMAAGAFAEPIVYDYQASVKHTYLKEKKFSKIFGEELRVNERLYIKYAKTSKLKGYLVQDVDGSLRFGNITKYDKQLGNRCFLVVQNKNAEKGYKYVRIIPGVIDVKWYNNVMKATSTVPAQGYLYLGGEIVKNDNEYKADRTNRKDGLGFFGTQFTKGLTGSLDKQSTISANYIPRLFSDFERNPSADNEMSTLFTDNTTLADIVKTRRADFGIDDYWFSSCYLFGKYNQPTWHSGAILGYRSNFLEEFADTWMNGAGFGKVKYTDDRVACCGQAIGGVGYTLDSLSGNLKAGMYLCTENGENEAHDMYRQYEVVGTRTGAAEDQLWLDLESSNPTSVRADGWLCGHTYQKITREIEDATNPDYPGKLNEYVVGVANNGTNAKIVWDVSKLDIWADGTLDLRTSDVGYGTWSIKRINWTKWADKVIAAGNLNGSELTVITSATDWNCKEPDATFGMLTCIKACMKNLDASANLLGCPVTGNNMIGPDFYKAYLMEGNN